MSFTRGTAKRSVRVLLNDLNDSDFAVSNEALELVIDHAMRELGQMAGYASTTGTSIAIDDSAGDFNVSGSIEYRYIHDVVLASLNIPLEKRSQAWIDEQRVGSAPAKGTPRFYAADETEAQVVRLSIYPRSGITDALSVTTSRLPAALTTDASTIPFSGDLKVGLEKLAAVYANRRVTTKYREQGIGIDPREAERMKQEAYEVAEQEKQRLLGFGLQNRIEELDA